MQSSSRSSPPSWQKEHLWLTLQALGFEAGAEAATAGKTLAHVTFGVNMFDRPNKDAFYVVFHFLFAKLDGGRCKEVMRYCWPPLDKKKDAEFRKLSCDWLKKISEEVGNGFPQVVASIFLSPGGPKFVQLLYHFARYVMLQIIKRDVDDEHSFIPDALQCRIQDPQKSLARNKVSRQRYLQTLQRENFVITEYQKKAQSLVKQIRDLRSEFSSLQTQSRATQSESDNSRREAKTEEVRSMWSTIMQTLKAMDKEMEVVDSVVVGDVDQFSLDGSNVTLNIPSILVTRIENEMYMLQLENVYETGKVNLVTIIQLLNEALKIIKQENVHKGCKEFQVDLQYLSAKVKFENEILQRLKNMRHKVKREDLVSINKSIAELEHEWDTKWEKFLGRSPFDVLRELNPIFRMRTFLKPLSFEPADDEELKNSLFSRYPVALPERPNSDSSLKEPHDSLTSYMDGTLFTPTGSSRKSLPLNKKLSLSTRRLSLNEKDLQTPSSNGKSYFQRTPNSAIQKSSDTSWQSPVNRLPQQTPTPAKPDASSAARVQLAQQVADYIVNETPKSVSNRGMELEDLIGMLSSDPFLSKKEIPRTPENLISDIRTSWRKAIQSEEFDVSSPSENPCMESPAEPESVHCSQMDLSMACFLSISQLSEHNESPETQVPTSTMKPPSSIQDADPSHSSISAKKPLQLEKLDLLKEFDNSRIFSPVVEKNQTYACENLASGNRANRTTLSALRPQNASPHTTLSWHSSSNVDYNNSLESHEVIQFGILHETLPDEAGNTSLNSTTSLETPETKKGPRGAQLLDNTDNSQKSTERKIDIDSIRSRYEALKRNFSVIEGKSSQEQTPLRRVWKQKSESSLLTDTGNMLTPLDKGLSLEYFMTPSPKGGRKLSLPQLISFSPAEDLHVKPTEELADVFESRGTGALNETFDFTQPAPDLQKCTDEGLGQLIKL